MAIDIGPSNPADAYLARGKAYAAAEEFEAARRDFEQANVLGHPDAQYELEALP